MMACSRLKPSVARVGKVVQYSAIPLTARASAQARAPRPGEVVDVEACAVGLACRLGQVPDHCVLGVREGQPTALQSR